MNWLQISVAVAGPDAARIGDRLEMLGAVAVSFHAAGSDEVLEPLPGEQPLWTDVQLDALFGLDLDLRQVRIALERDGARLIDAVIVADDDWSSRWRTHAVRAVFGGRLRLLPRDEPIPNDAAPNAAVLRLDPGLAFGSGAHPTTRLCLAWLAEAALEGRRVLDYGCGSGVLALAALLLGAREVVAIDHDPQALTATLDNAAYNGVDGARLRVAAPELLRDDAAAVGRFDVVVANILANPLVALAPLLTTLLAPGGSIVLSGLLSDQVERVQNAYPGVRFGAPVVDEDWIRLDGTVR